MKESVAPNEDYQDSQRGILSEDQVRASSNNYLTPKIAYSDLASRAVIEVVPGEVPMMDFRRSDGLFLASKENPQSKKFGARIAQIKSTTVMMEGFETGPLRELYSNGSAT